MSRNESIRKLEERYIRLKEESKKISDELSKLRRVILEWYKMHPELFTRLEVKTVEVDEFEPRKVYEHLGLEKFLQVVSVLKKKLKEFVTEEELPKIRSGVKLEERIVVKKEA